jgi:hypothetical protein
MLIDSRRGEVLKNHEKNEKIVDAKGLLDDVAGEKLESFFLSPNKIDSEVKNQGQQNPYRAPNRRLFDGDSMRFAMKYAEIEGEHAQHKEIKCNP